MLQLTRMESRYPPSTTKNAIKLRRTNHFRKEPEHREEDDVCVCVCVVFFIPFSGTNLVFLGLKDPFIDFALYIYEIWSDLMSLEKCRTSPSLFRSVWERTPHTTGDASWYARDPNSHRRIRKNINKSSTFNSTTS